MATQTDPLVIRLTSPSALRVEDAGGGAILEVDTLTRALKIAGGLFIDGASGSFHASFLQADADLLYEALGDIATHAAIAAAHHASFVQADADLLYDALGGLAAHAALPEPHHDEAHDHTTADGSGVLTNDEHDGYSLFDEIGAPGAPAANKARLYALDDGDGNTMLEYVDSGGSALPLGVIEGALVDRPVPSKAGREYWCTDIDLKFRDDGSKWNLIGIDPLNTNIAWSSCTEGPGQGFFNEINGGTGDIVNPASSTGQWLMTTGVAAGSSANVRFHSVVHTRASIRIIYMAMRGFYSGGNNTGLYIRLGVTDQLINGDPTNGIYFRVPAGGANWIAVTRAAGAETTTDTGIVSTGAQKSLEILSDGSTVKFYVDSVLKATHTTHIPSANVMYEIKLSNTSAALDKQFSLDGHIFAAKGV